MPGWPPPPDRAPLPPGPTFDARAERHYERDPWGVVEALIRQYGDTFTVYRPGRPPRVHVCAPDEVREIFIGHAEDLRVVASSLFGELAGEHSVGGANGAEHRELRKLLAPSLQGDRLRAHSAAISRITVETLARRSTDAGVPLTGITQEISLRVIVLFAFGHLPPERADQILDTFHQVTDSLRSADGGFPDRRDQLDALVHREISRARHDPGPFAGSLLADLATAEPEVPDRTVRDQLVTLLVAAQESTPAAMAIAVDQIHRHPQVLRALRSELATLPAPFPLDRMADLPYLGAVCEEALRLSSVVPTGFTRRVIRPFQALGWQFTAPTEFVACLHAVHRRPELYPTPRTFVPDRFLARRFSGTEYLPFGTGAHRCLGAALALHEMKIAIGMLLTMPGIAVWLHGSGSARPRRSGPTLVPPDTIRIQRIR
ncbi:cytochrome P450 [Streptomyces sp. NPDC002730]|uniref:cytochrome P450 n=1 Tax=Streptomyces sp. NPDC002730 TaxID=3364662 RepID=UPI0036A9216C